MKRTFALVAIGFSVVLLGHAAMSIPTVEAATSTRIRLWLLPPMDQLGNKACLTQRWHSTDSRCDYLRALDWRADCGASSNQSEFVNFNYLGADLDAPWNPGAQYAAMYGPTSDLETYRCGLGTVHEGKVKLFGQDGLLKGFMIYAHTNLFNDYQFPIYVRPGATRSTAYWGWAGLGWTTQDSDDEDEDTPCWTGWHVHEINSDDAVMYWDSWNSKWDTAPTFTGYDNSDDANWIRRMTWTLVTP